MNTNNLTQVIEFAMRISKTKRSLIDKMFLDKRRNGSYIVHPSKNGLSNHDRQILN
jgi:hypothetical protein